MKAAVVVANEDVQYQEVEEPKVKPGWVKIKVKASGICGDQGRICADQRDLHGAEQNV